jgi:hypothetical protein
LPGREEEKKGENFPPSTHQNFSENDDKKSVSLEKIQNFFPASKKDKE